MAAHQITYEGPSSLAVRAATMLADADGVELVSSQPPERRDKAADKAADKVVLAFTVEGTAKAVMAAVRIVGDSLPPTATMTIEQATQHGP
jgi:hypothetical protein